MPSISTFLSLLSTLCWIFSLIPQLWHNYQTKSVSGLSPYLLFLWFTGDLFNAIGCITTHQLPFQTYLSIYFLMNDIILDFQYLYYNKSNKNHHFNHFINNDNISICASSVVELLTDNNSNNDDYNNDDNNENHNVNNNDSNHYYMSTRSNSFKPQIFSKSQIITTTTALLSTSPCNALPLSILTKESQLSSLSTHFNIGIIFAWLCTVIYCSSRLPQLYHNYKRKSVDGISPLLFTFAILANSTYALSILFSNDLTSNDPYSNFIIKELPYLFGSLGTVLFDCIYFWQREHYKIK